MPDQEDKQPITPKAKDRDPSTPDQNVKVPPGVVQKLAEGVEGGVSKKSKKEE